MTFAQLLKGQTDDELVDIYNHTLENLKRQQRAYNTDLIVLSFLDHIHAIENELKERGLAE